MRKNKTSKTKLSKNANIPHDLPNYIDPRINLEQVKKDCNNLVRSRAAVSAGVAVIPVPFLDVAVDAGLLSVVLPEITARFGLIDSVDDLSKLPRKDERMRNIKDNIFSFAKIIAARGVVKQTLQGFGMRIIAKQFGKFIPFGGQIFAASLGYMIFSKIANAHINECLKLAERIQKESEDIMPHDVKTVNQ